MISKVLATILILIAGAVGFVLYVSHAAQKLPENNPARYLEKKISSGARKVIVCVGDSITHGRVSTNYVDILSERLAPKGFELVNAGINSQLAYNVGLRLDEIVKCKPAYITILIGTNDANATLSESSKERLIKQQKLPQTPDPEWYRENLVKICKELKKRTTARIALLSLPPIGEELDHRAYKRAADYSRTIHEVARQQGLTYIPLHEIATEYLRRNPHRPQITYDDDSRVLLYKSLIRHYLFRQSFDEIAEANGNLLLIDVLHPNSRGAGMIADLIEQFVMRFPFEQS